MLWASPRHAHTQAYACASKNARTQYLATNSVIYFLADGARAKACMSSLVTHIMIFLDPFLSITHAHAHAISRDKSYDLLGLACEKCIATLKKLLVSSRVVLLDHCYGVASQVVSRPQTTGDRLSILFSEDGWISWGVDASFLCSAFETVVYRYILFPGDRCILEGVHAVLPRSAFETVIL